MTNSPRRIRVCSRKRPEPAREQRRLHRCRGLTCAGVMMFDAWFCCGFLVMAMLTAARLPTRRCLRHALWSESWGKQRAGGGGLGWKMKRRVSLENRKGRTVSLSKLRCHSRSVPVKCVELVKYLLSFGLIYGHAEHPSGNCQQRCQRAGSLPIFESTRDVDDQKLVRTVAVLRVPDFIVLHNPLPHQTRERS